MWYSTVHVRVIDSYTVLNETSNKKNRKDNNLMESPKSNQNYFYVITVDIFSCMYMHAIHAYGMTGC